jgi:hypothetical protein
LARWLPPVRVSQIVLFRRVRGIGYLVIAALSLIPAAAIGHEQGMPRGMAAWLFAAVLGAALMEFGILNLVRAYLWLAAYANGQI